MSKNLESLACTFGLGSTLFVLYINISLHFCAFLAKFGNLCLSFSLLVFGGFFFVVAQLHACVVCLALPAGLAVVPTQGSYFAFAFFFVFGKQIYFGSEG